MIFAKAYFNTPSFTGDVFYRFEDDTTPAKMLMLDYIGSSATSFEEVTEYEWATCEDWTMYVAYPEFGHTFIFAVDADLTVNEEIAKDIVSNVQSWGFWSGHESHKTKRD